MIENESERNAASIYAVTRVLNMIAATGTTKTSLQAVCRLLINVTHQAKGAKRTAHVGIALETWPVPATRRRGKHCFCVAEGKILITFAQHEIDGHEVRAK